MQYRSGDEDALPHAFRIRRQRGVPADVKRKQVQEIGGLFVDDPSGKTSKAAHQLQILQPGERRIDVSLFGHVTQPALEADEIAADVAAVEQDFSRRRL